MIGKHPLGIYEKAWSPADDWHVRLDKASVAGFDFLEISIDEADERLNRLYWSSKDMEALRRCSCDAGVPISSMCLSGHRRFPFGSADKAVAERAHEIMERALDFAAAVGVRVIQLAGYDVYYEPSTEASREAFLEGMRWSAKLAEQYQIMLAMEIMDTPFLNSITRYRWFKERIPSPYFNVYPDIGNLTAWNNDVAAELTMGISDIVAVHLKDALRVTDTFPGKFKCVPFGTGCVDFAGFFRIMERLHFAGPYMMEMWYTPGGDDRADVASAKRFMETMYAAGVANKSVQDGEGTV